MPSTSKAQQKFMQMVMAQKHGQVKNPSEKLKKAARSMTEKQTREFMVLKKMAN